MCAGRSVGRREPQQMKSGVRSVGRVWSWEKGPLTRTHTCTHETTEKGRGSQLWWLGGVRPLSLTPFLFSPRRKRQKKRRDAPRTTTSVGQEEQGPEQGAGGKKSKIDSSRFVYLVCCSLSQEEEERGEAGASFFCCLPPPLLCPAPSCSE